MSPQNRSLIAGLAAPGLLWLTTSVAFGQSPPAPQAPPTQAPTSAMPTFAALLLSNGKVVRGEIVEDAAAGLFRARQSGGTVPYPKSMVMKAANSVEELYQYQVARLPVGDPDERMKLVRWCLTEHLPAQAKEHLLAILAICPDDTEVKRMLYNLNASADRAVVTDPSVRRTSVEMPQGEAPAALDPRFLKKVTKGFNGPPQIFDLPAAQAVRLAGAFTDYVQPVLLQSCAKCHNEHYQGPFQLVEIKILRDRQNPDIARANLDAALRLVNPDDPRRSELLSAGLVPHGTRKNAIFRGPNDRSYQILETWVKNLRPVEASRTPAGAANRSGFAPAEPAPGDGFAADRSGKPSGVGPTSPSMPPSASLPPLPGMSGPSEGIASMPPPPPRRIVQNLQQNADYSEASRNSTFPLPFAAGGAPPTSPGSRTPAARTASPRSPATAQTPPPPPGPNAAPPAGPSAVVVGPSDDPNKLPGMNQPLYPSLPRDEPDDPVDPSDPAKKKPKKIDNALLEKLIKNRNGTP